jgi:hypothetical protein
MIIVSDLFNYPGDTRYEKMAKVLEYSAKKYSPNVEFRMIRHEAPKTIRGKTCFASNNLKLQKWVEMLDHINDDVILLDCDMAILRDVSNAFDEPGFDIGITYLNDARERLPFNGGTIFVRNTDSAKAFMRKWLEIDNHMYRSDDKLHAHYRDKYAGMNQASLGMLLEHEEMQSGAVIKKLDCHEWNWCRDRWVIPKNGMGPRVLHIKSQTRKNVFLPTAIELLDPKVREAVRIWRNLADEAGAQKFPEEALNPGKVVFREGAYVYNSKPKTTLQFGRTV